MRSDAGRPCAAACSTNLALRLIGILVLTCVNRSPRLGAGPGIFFSILTP